HVIGGDQPPQRGVDAADVPEVGLLLVGVDVLGDLAVGALVRGQRVEALDGALFERRYAAAAHAERTDRRVAAKHARVAVRLGSLGAARREDAAASHVLLQQPQRRALTRGEQRYAQ